MFGIPMEVITMLGSTLGGAVMRIWSQSNADKASQWKMALEAGRETETSRSAAREWSTPHANWTRRVLSCIVYGNGYVSYSCSITRPDNPSSYYIYRRL